MSRQLNIAVLFDGAGLARLGLEQAGHICTGYELHPAKHHLSTLLGSGNCQIANVLDLTPADMQDYDAIWASPPCQSRSGAGDSNTSKNKLDRDLNDRLLEHTFKLCQSVGISWIENVIEPGGNNSWGIKYNAAQFLEVPIQNRQRVIGGVHESPFVWREYKQHYHGDGWNLPMAVMASMWKRGNYGSKDASVWYGRRLTIRECAYHQGLTIPESLLQSWFYPMPGYTASKWRRQLYEAIGNGVPVYMSKAFGEAYSKPNQSNKQLELFDVLDYQIIPSVI